MSNCNSCCNSSLNSSCNIRTCRNYLYTDEDINTLFNNYYNRNQAYYITTIAALNENQSESISLFKDILNRLIVKLTNSTLYRTGVIPLNLGSSFINASSNNLEYINSHWVGLVLKKYNIKGLHAYYIDSLGNSINSNIETALKNLGIKNIKDFKEEQQTNRYDCGPWTIFYLDYIAKNNKFPKDISDYEIIAQRVILNKLNRPSKTLKTLFSSSTSSSPPSSPPSSNSISS